MLNNFLDKSYLQGLLDQKGKSEFSESSKKNDISWYALPSAEKVKVSIRFLPPWEGSKTPGMIIRRHYNLPGDTKSFLCFGTHNLPCPFCEVLKKYDGITEIKNWIPVAKSYFNALVMNDPTYVARYQKQVDPTKVHIFGAGEFMFYWLVEKLLSPDVGEAIIDPKSGHNLTLWRKTFNGAVEREYALRPSPIAQSDEEIEQILGSMHKLNEIWRLPDDEYLMKAKTIAKLLDAEVEKSLHSMKANGKPIDTNYYQQQEPPMKETEEQPKTSERQLTQAPRPAVKTPADAPICFGDQGAYNEESDMCTECRYEFECKKSIARSMK